MHAGSASKYRALGTWAASNLGVGVNALGNHHDVGFLVRVQFRLEFWVVVAVETLHP